MLKKSMQLGNSTFLSPGNGNNEKNIHVNIQLNNNNSGGTFLVILPLL